jgi:endoglucanase
LSNNDFEKLKARIYPNPATNLLNIESEVSIEKVTVYNILGQEVISKSPNTELVTLDVSNLQVGVYIVKTSINGNISSTRFIKD